MKHIKIFEEFKVNEELNIKKWWSGAREDGNSWDNGSPRDSIVDWYNLFGRALFAIPTLGTNILIEKGINYMMDQIKRNKYLLDIIEKLSNDDIITEYLTNHRLSYGEQEGPRPEYEVIAKNRIGEILTREEINFLVNHVDLINKKLKQ